MFDSELQFVVGQHHTARAGSAAVSHLVSHGHTTRSVGQSGCFEGHDLQLDAFSYAETVLPRLQTDWTGWNGAPSGPESRLMS